MAQSTSRRSCSVVGEEPLMKYVGTMQSSYREGKEYAAFFGIPYAARPVGVERYQPAKPFIPEKTPDGSLPTYEADVKGKICTQLMSSSKPEGTSDCLYLNIFLPKHPEEIEELLPVLVFIHGGGFTDGSNDPKEYTPDYIVHHGLVFVTINYRLGLFGFLNTPSAVCPGNTGLKDQVNALQWIRDNIACFKGDPGNVTISGSSAGGTCVNMHLMSPLSKDLFHKAIIQSGGVFCPWGFMGHQRQRNEVLKSDKEFQRLLLDTNESWSLQERARYLLDAYFQARRPDSFAPVLGPTVENCQEGAFVTGTLEEIMNNARHCDKPVMAGITKAEGIALFTVENPGIMYQEYMKSDQFREVLMDNFRWSTQTAGMYVDKIRNKYFPNPHCMPRQQRDRSLANFIRDVQFRRFYDNLKFGPEKTLPRNLYIYRFDHVSPFSVVQCQNMTGLNDATHGDEVRYLFPPLNLIKYVTRTRPREFREIEAVINHMCSLWANFCKSGIPKSDFDKRNSVWRPHTEEEPCFLSISKNLRLIEAPLFREEWDWLNAVVNPQPTVDSPPGTP